MKKTTKLTFGLFDTPISHPFHWVKRTFKDIGILIHRISFLLVHGYNEQALWENYAYFIDMYSEILTWYRYNRMGTPVITGTDYFTNEGDKRNEEAYNALLDKMRELLSKAVADDDIPNVEAAREFFNLFGQHFFSFWD